jgi:flagellar motor protein MotB
MSQRQHQGEEGLPEWIMSYADMITILMAFFVVMYSTAGEKSSQKQEAVLESLRSWLGPLRPGSLRGLSFDGLRGGYPGIQPRLLATKDADQRGDSRRGKTSSNWRDMASIGTSLYFDLEAKSLTTVQQQQLQRIHELLAGKLQLVEIRGLPSPRLVVEQTEPGRDSDLTWAKCRNVADYLVSLGIERPRLQLNVVSPNSESQDPNLLEPGHDFRIDVKLSERFLRSP